MGNTALADVEAAGMSGVLAENPALISLIDTVATGASGEGQMLDKLLAANSIEGLQAVYGKAPGLSNWVGRHIRIEGFRGIPSKFPNLSGWAFVLEVTDLDSGETQAASTGSDTVMALIAKMHQFGKVPFVAWVREGSKKEGQNAPVYLEIDGATK